MTLVDNLDELVAGTSIVTIDWASRGLDPALVEEYIDETIGNLVELAATLIDLAVPTQARIGFEGTLRHYRREVPE